nr:MAG: P12 protein [Japanese holly fern mottle virus]
MACWMCSDVLSLKASPVVDGWFEVLSPKPCRGFKSCIEHRLFISSTHLTCELSSLSQPQVEELLKALNVSPLWLSVTPSFAKHLHLHYFGTSVFPSLEKYICIKE